MHNSDTTHQTIFCQKSSFYTTLKILSTSDKYHESIAFLLSKNDWEIGKNLCKRVGYQIDAYKDRVALQIALVNKMSGRGIDIIHRDLFRLMVLHSLNMIDAGVLVLRVKKSGEINYHRVVIEIKAIEKAVSVPILLFGI